SKDVPGQQVVLDEPPVDRPVGGDDGVVAFLDPYGAVRGFAALEVGGGLGLHDVWGYSQSDSAIDRAPAPGDPGAVLGDDVVVEESCGPGTGVGDQGLVLGQFQLEVIPQELGQACFDLLGLGLGSGEPEQLVVGIPDVMQPAVARVRGVLAGYGPH